MNTHRNQIQIKILKPVSQRQEQRQADVLPTVREYALANNCSIVGQIPKRKSRTLLEHVDYFTQNYPIEIDIKRIRTYFKHELTRTERNKCSVMDICLELCSNHKYTYDRKNNKLKRR